MGGKGERGVKNLKQWVMSFMDGPLSILQDDEARGVNIWPDS